ncbi:extradiol dioxygenase [Tardisphaera miroshnichenkoae]
MITFMAVSPHGDELLRPSDPESVKLNEAMRAVAREREKAQIDTWVVLTPHNIRIPDHFAVLTCENLQGEVSGKAVTVKTDLELARAISARARSLGAPVVEVNYGALEGPLSSLPLDWGTSIPLSFLYHGEKLVVIGPAREVERKALLSFGSAVGEECARSQKGVGIIVSADNAHAHRADGPYGFSPAAKAYDDLVVKAFKESDLGLIAGIDDALLEAAKPDSFWQFMVMLGILSVKPMKPVFLAYGLPSYFGMLVAYFKESSREPFPHASLGGSTP